MDRFKPLEPSKRRNEALVIVLLVLVLFASLTPIRAARAADEPLSLQLEVLLNGQPSKRIGTFSDLGQGRIAATGATLTDLGFKAGATLAPEESIALDELAGITYTYDEAAQSIDIIVADAERDAHVVDAGRNSGTTAEPTDDLGAALNYALYGSTSEALDNGLVEYGGASLTLGGRIFGPLGLLTTDGLLDHETDGDTDARRLATTWSYSDTENLVTYRAGDIITGGLAWTRPVRLGGAQVDRNFGLKPGLITMPLPSLEGSAVVPSSVDVYVNATKAYSGQVAGGPFAIENIPAITGSGQARIVIRDASGREQEITTDFYASPSLLREGLFDYSAEAGVLRSGFGSGFDAYDDTTAGSASLRYGLYDELTLEAHAEATSGLVNGGVGAVVNVADKAIVSLAASASSSDEGQGISLYAAIETEIYGVSLRGSTTRTLGDYADLGSLSYAHEDDDEDDKDPATAHLISSTVPRAIDQLSIGAPLPYELGTMGLSYTHIDREDDPEVHLVSASYSRSLMYEISLYTSAFHDFGEEPSSGVYAGLSMSLGDYGSLSTGVKHDKDGTGIALSNSKSLEEAPGSVGWYASIDAGEETSAAASLSYRAEVATATVRARSHKTGTAASGEILGAIAATEDGVFFANRIDDGFAVVDAGAEGVPIMLENRKVATTNSNGKALVTGLRAYEPNKISIDAVDLPLDTEITETEHIAVPRERAGVRVVFNARKTTGAALVTVKLADGSYPPAGAGVVLDASEADYVMGYDGQVYLEGLTGAHVIIVTLDSGQCRAEIAYASSGDNFSTLDPVICQ